MPKIELDKKVPIQVFANEHALKLNGSSIGLKHYGAAHTDSDISVRFGEADILHVADTFWNGVYPFIDYSTGGSIDGMIAASDANLAIATEKTIIIPGYGQPVSNRDELKEFREMLLAIREKVATLKNKEDLETRPSRLDRPPHLTQVGQFRRRSRLLHPACVRRGVSAHAVARLHGLTLMPTWRIR